MAVKIKIKDSPVLIDKPVNEADPLKAPKQPRDKRLYRPRFNGVQYYYNQDEYEDE